MPQQESISRPRFRRLFAPIQGHVPEPTASSSKDSDRFPWRFQSNCKGPRCSGPRPLYCRTENSCAPSQRALCCAQRGCWRAPVCRPPDSAPDRATAPEDSAELCPRQTLVRFGASAYLPMTTRATMILSRMALRNKLECLFRGGTSRPFYIKAILVT